MYAVSYFGRIIAQRTPARPNEAASLTDAALSKLGLADPPLQTLLTTSLRPFAQIQRDRGRLLGPSPTDAEYASSIEEAATLPSHEGKATAAAR